MVKTTLTLTPIRSALLAGHDNKTCILVRVRAAEAKKGEVNYVKIVISGSR